MYKSRVNFLLFSKRKKNSHFKKKNFTMFHNKQTKKTAGRRQPSPRQTRSQTSSQSSQQTSSQPSSLQTLSQSSSQETPSSQL